MSDSDYTLAHHEEHLAALEGAQFHEMREEQRYAEQVERDRDPDPFAALKDRVCRAAVRVYLSPLSDTDSGIAFKEAVDALLAAGWKEEA